MTSVYSVIDFCNKVRNYGLLMEIVTIRSHNLPGCCYVRAKGYICRQYRVIYTRRISYATACKVFHCNEDD